jgi:hypothetical protein
MRVLPMFLFAGAAFAGQMPAPAPQPLTWSHVGRQAPVSKEPLTLSGILVDGSCEYRSSLNLRERPQLAPAPVPKQPTGGVSAYGVTVDAETLQRERADALAHQVPDLRMRESDPTCAITGSTRSFALLLNNGLLLNLDEGGNTMALQYLQSDPAGRALLNGSGPAMKPWMTIQGRMQGAKLTVEKIVKTGGGT